MGRELIWNSEKLSPVDNARCLDARLEFLGQGTELQKHDLRRDLEGVFDGAFDLLAGAGLVDAAPELEREAQHVLVALRQRLAFEIIGRGGAKDEVLEFAVIDVDASDLEEAGGAMRVLDDRKDRKRSAAGPLRPIGDDIARQPAQKRGRVVGEQWRDHEGTDLPVWHRAPRHLIDDFDEKQIGPNPES